MEPLDHCHDAERGEPGGSLLERQLETLYLVSQALSRSLKRSESWSEVLRVLADGNDLCHGMIGWLGGENGDRQVTVLHERPMPFKQVRYKAGEGVIGKVIESGQPRVLRRVSDDEQFLDCLGVHDPALPFVAVPIPVDGQPVGLLAVQPVNDPSACSAHEHFLQMVANLIGQRVGLARLVEEERQELKRERDALRREVRGEHGFSSMVGHARSMQVVFDQVRQVAPRETAVLLRGESGTGKALIAHAIHYNSPRVDGPFVKFNCATLPDKLLESELFGHENGADSSAMNQRKGRFEQARGGTIFLDEIGETSLALQIKLLRVLQGGEFERVGGTTTRTADVRVVAATSKDLGGEVDAGGFDDNLYRLLNAMPIQVPPLRKRLEDVPELARFLVARIAKGQARELWIEDAALRALMSYDWPGNVRELENCLERAAVLTRTQAIGMREISMAGIRASAASSARATRVARVALDDPGMGERERIVAALEQAGWVQAKAARLLGMTPRQVSYRIQTLNIEVRQI